MKRNLAALLCIAMLVSMTACGGNTAETESETSAQTETVVETETELKDNLPDRDFEGYTVNILSAAEQWQKFYLSEETTGEAINDAVYERNSSVQERFDVKLNYQIFNGYGAGREPVKTALSGSVMSGGGDFDLVVAHGAYTVHLFPDRLLTDLKEVEYLDLNAPWWFQYNNKQLEINNQLYLGSGAFGMLNYARTIVTFFSTTVVENYDLEDPYTFVQNGTWTWETMLELAQKVLTDVDGDGQYNEHDITGITSTANYLRLSSHSMDYDFTSHEADGSIKYLSPTEKMVHVNEILYSLFSGIYKDAYLDVQENTAYAPEQEVNLLVGNFAEDNVLFFIHCLEYAELESMRNMAGYGIIPTPKYNEAQSEYYSTVTPEIAAIPSVVSDMERSGILLEALQFATYDIVRPAYYNVALKGKYLRDETSGQMLDLIFESIVCPTTYVFDLYPGYMMGVEENMVSWYTADMTKNQNTLDELKQYLSN